MNMSCNLTLVDDILLESMISSKEFREFSNTINELEILSDASIYTEAVKDTSPDAKKFLGTVKKNTWDTTKDVGKVYGDIVDGNASVLKASWDLAVKIVHSIVKVLKYVLDKIASVPKFIIRIGTKLSNISVDTLAKISGNITLNITANDIEMIYNKLFIRRLIDYINDASSLSKGDFWSTFTNQRKSDKRFGIIKENDMKTCKRMMTTYGYLQNTEFRSTVIDLKNKDNVNIYFGSDKLISFTDTYGVKHNMSYYEALTKLIEDLNSKKPDIETIHTVIGNKLKETELNQSYANLRGHNKYILNTTLSQISKVSAIIGNFIKYIMIDMNTINTNIDKIIGIKGNKPVKK